MPSVEDLTSTDYARGYRDGYDDAIRAIGLDGHSDKRNDALLLSIAVVDMYLDRSATLDEFKAKWLPAKHLYLELVAQGTLPEEHRVS